MTILVGHLEQAMDVGVGEAKARFSELLQRAEAGERIVVTRRGRPVVELTAWTEPDGRAAQLGNASGSLDIHDDFDAPLPDDIAAAFGA